MLRRRPNVMKISGSVGVRMLEDQNCELEMTFEFYHMKFGLNLFPIQIQAVPLI